jgi:hypothetical protein
MARYLVMEQDRQIFGNGPRWSKKTKLFAVVGMGQSLTAVYVGRVSIYFQHRAKKDFERGRADSNNSNRQLSLLNYPFSTRDSGTSKQLFGTED